MSFLTRIYTNFTFFFETPFMVKKKKTLCTCKQSEPDSENLAMKTQRHLTVRNSELRMKGRQMEKQFS